MKKYLCYTVYIFFFCLLFSSCSLVNNLTNRTIRKEIKTNSELQKGDLIYENNLAVVYFDRKLTLKVLRKELKNKFFTKCDKNRLIKCIENIEKGNATLFEHLNNDFFDEMFKNRILELLLLKSKFSILNKSTGIYEKYLIYNKSKMMVGHCCFVDFEFPNGDRFITTRIATSIVIIEKCDE